MYWAWLHRFHMVEWHLILALSGQQANLPAGSLVFDFADKTLTSGSYPVILPGVLGTIEASATARNLTVHIGTLSGITHLAVGASVYSGGTVNLGPGQSVAW